MHLPVGLDIETKFPYFLFFTWLSKSHYNFNLWLIVLSIISDIFIVPGTVTRCPIELRLKFNPDHSEPWHGHIYAKNEKNQEYEADLKVPENVATEVERGGLTIIAGFLTEKKIIRSLS